MDTSADGHRGQGLREGKKRLGPKEIVDDVLKLEALRIAALHRGLGNAPCGGCRRNGARGERADEALCPPRGRDRRPRAGGQPLLRVLFRRISSTVGHSLRRGTKSVSYPLDARYRLQFFPPLLRDGIAAENDFSRLAAFERERPVLVYAREPMMHLCFELFRTTHALPPRPLQRLGQRLASEVLRLLLRKLTDGEVCLLLAGARFTEGNPPDLHYRPM